ncbi:helix-turn-helix domain-containing protein [Actinoplanes siamensis]|uniref:Resolvase HTH domain-containing protein n=1 Tax=Actinoplanes siamensis TaxID=1223317 RepID=A0A919N604_9ACTN|nr:hypothetical protein [Actinoplanes siamensis]GIF04992.1 hypothetical protein Asi03nite_25300 [Actinoplanes siamensis]
MTADIDTLLTAPYVLVADRRVSRQARGDSVTAIARRLGVGRSTRYRALDTAGDAAAEDDVDARTRV